MIELLDAVTKLLEPDYHYKIKVLAFSEHNKASEEYLDVEFTYPTTRRCYIRLVIKSPRQSIDCETPEDIRDLVVDAWKKYEPTEDAYWKKYFEDEAAKLDSKNVTGRIFRVLIDNEWHCTSHDPTGINRGIRIGPNPAARIKDLKNIGFTLSSMTSYPCKRCKKSTLAHLLLRDKKREVEKKYELWTKEERSRIVKVLGGVDVFGDKKISEKYLLPDHKFPEIRWDESMWESSNDTDIMSMKDEEIKKKYQLMTNLKNEKKRELCRNCMKENKRPSYYGIEHFYEGNEAWPEDVKRSGVEAEKGCEGCPWYDFAKWKDDIEKKNP